MIQASDFEIAAFTGPSTVRLIFMACINEPAMAPLVDNDGELVIIKKIEGLTSARRSTTLAHTGKTPSGRNSD